MMCASKFNVAMVVAVVGIITDVTLAAVSNAYSTTKASGILSGIVVGMFVFYGHSFAVIWSSVWATRNRDSRPYSAILHNGRLFRNFSALGSASFGISSAVFLAIAVTDSANAVQIASSAGAVFSAGTFVYFLGTIKARVQPLALQILDVSISTGGIVPACWRPGEHMDRPLSVPPVTSAV